MLRTVTILDAFYSKFADDKFSKAESANFGHSHIGHHQLASKRKNVRFRRFERMIYLPY